MKNKNNSSEKGKQKLSNDEGRMRVKKVPSNKSRSEEIADKSEGFGASPEELDGHSFDEKRKDE